MLLYLSASSALRRSAHKVAIVGNAAMLGNTLRGDVHIVFWRAQEGYISGEKAPDDSPHLEDVSSEN